MASFNATVDSYRGLLANVDAGGLELPNENFDLGIPVVSGPVQGADLAYDKLLDKLAGHKFAGASPDLRSNILDFLKDRKPPAYPATKKAGAEWAKLIQERAQFAQLSGKPLRPICGSGRTMMLELT